MRRVRIKHKPHRQILKIRVKNILPVVWRRHPRRHNRLRRHRRVASVQVFATFPASTRNRTSCRPRTPVRSRMRITCHNLPSTCIRRALACRPPRQRRKTILRPLLIDQSQDIPFPLLDRRRNHRHSQLIMSPAIISPGRNRRRPRPDNHRIATSLRAITEPCPRRRRKTFNHRWITRLPIHLTQPRKATVHTNIKIRCLINRNRILTPKFARTNLSIRDTTATQSATHRTPTPRRSRAPSITTARRPAAYPGIYDRRRR